jgi:hypothetical protein
MQQQATQAALQNQQLAMQLAQEKFNLYSQAKNQAMQAARAAVPTIPIGDLIDPNGQVRWPQVAPNATVHGDRRAAADEAIASAYREFASTGRTSVANASAAIQALHAYGRPALDLLRVRRDTRARATMVDFLNALEAALNTMANPPKPDEGNQGEGGEGQGQNTRPANGR